MGPALPQMMELIDWLKSHIPADDADPSVGRISHGDYRCMAYMCSICQQQACNQHGCRLLSVQVLCCSVHSMSQDAIPSQAEHVQ